jgi:hypothetical protein
VEPLPGVICGRDDGVVHGVVKWKFERQPKPTPVGLKLLGLACPQTGYVVSFLLDKKGESTVEDKVMTLCRRVKGL